MSSHPESSCQQDKIEKSVIKVVKVTPTLTEIVDIPVDHPHYLGEELRKQFGDRPTSLFSIGYNYIVIREDKIFKEVNPFFDIIQQSGVNMISQLGPLCFIMKETDSGIEDMVTDHCNPVSFAQTLLEDKKIGNDRTDSFFEENEDKCQQQ